METSADRLKIHIANARRAYHNLRTAKGFDGTNLIYERGSGRGEENFGVDTAQNIMDAMVEEFKKEQAPEVLKMAAEMVKFAIEDAGLDVGPEPTP